MGADIVERLEAIASREDQVFGAMSNGLEIREAAAEIVRLRGEVGKLAPELDAMTAGYERMTAYVISHKGSLVYMSESAYSAYADVVVERDAALASIAPAEAKGCNCGGCEVCDATDLLPQPAGGEAAAWVCSPAENIAQHVGINSDERQKLIDAGFDVSHYRPLVYGDATPPAAQVQPPQELAMAASGIRSNGMYVKGWNDCREAMLTPPPCRRGQGAGVGGRLQSVRSAGNHYVRRCNPCFGSRPLPASERGGVVMEWLNDLSKNAHETMAELGNFGPTVKPEYREVKGYKMDANDGECGKCYYNSTDLRNIAAGCIEVADWLDKRAALAEQEPQP